MLGNHSPIKKCSLAFLAFVYGLFFVAQSPALAGSQVPFKAAYSIEFSITVDGPIATVTSHGAGLARHLGVITTRTISETVNLATGEGNAVHEFTAANGDTLLIRFHFLAIPVSATGFDISGGWEVASGTGRFSGASGSGPMKGHVEFTSPLDGGGDFELGGTISSPGSLR